MSESLRKAGSAGCGAESDVSADFTKYSLGCCIKPIWSGDTVYNETLMFVPDVSSKETAPAPLLYMPEKIISVRSFDLKTEYEEGRDYTVAGGRIKLTPGSRIPRWSFDEYWPESPSIIPIGSVYAAGRYVRFGGGDLFEPTQVCVTYTHADAWMGPVPQYQGHRLVNTEKLLLENKPFKIVYYGDSITVGCDTSGWVQPGRDAMAPFMPIWPDMVTEEIKAATGNKNIVASNTAVGGQQSRWGVENIGSRVADYKPDLTVIAFGMNDSGVPVTPDEFQSNTEAMIEAVRAVNPKAEFVLVSTTLPNPDGNGWTKYQPEYEKNLLQIVDTVPGTALAPMTGIHKYVLSRKRYCDMAGNNINHPNDFLARIYAQTVAQIILKNLR